jgi:hypothetical protein
MNPTKLQSLLLYIIENLNHNVGSIELAKILYLVDVESMSLVGHTISGEEYTRQKKGPLSRNFKNALDSMNGFEVALVIVPTRSGIPKNCHSVGKKLRFVPQLDDSDILAANRVLNRIGGLAPIDLEKLAYNTEPMKIIIDKEKKLGKSLNGEILDLNSIAPHPIISKWRDNMKVREIPDPEYDEFLKQESEEIDSILASF